MNVFLSEVCALVDSVWHFFMLWFSHRRGKTISTFTQEMQKHIMAL